MAAIKTIEVFHPAAIRRSIDRVQISQFPHGVVTVWESSDGLVSGAEPVNVVLTYLDEPQTLHGFYFPNALQFMELP